MPTKKKKNIKLTIELVPKTAWYTNVRSNVPKEDWDIIRKKCYNLANNVCEICGDTSKNQGKPYDLECHETWEYDDKNHIQKLTGLIGLCNHCHTVKHPGLAGMQGRGSIVIDQLIKVNKMSETEADDYINKAFEIWQERSNHKWTLDITYLDEYLKTEKERLENKMGWAVKEYQKQLKIKIDMEEKLKKMGDDEMRERNEKERMRKNNEKYIDLLKRRKINEKYIESLKSKENK